MKKYLLYTIFLLIGLFVISSCIESIHKLYTSEDLVFKEKLLGYWKQPNGAKWIFKEDPNTGYDLTHINQKGDTTKLDAHVLKLDSYRFLDMKLLEKSVMGIT